MSINRRFTQQAWVFVGEKRSQRAQHIGVTWADVALCSKTLHEALRACGIHGTVNVVNLWDDSGLLDTGVVRWLKLRQAEGYTLIGLGKKVQAMLTTVHIPHHAMIHPAARGKIRRRALYHAHVKDVMQRAGAHIDEETLS